MFSRFGINENCAEFLPNHFVPNIQDSRKFLVKRHASYESFLNLGFGFFYQTYFHKLTSLTDFEKCDIILKHKKPAENFVFPADKNKRPFVRNWLTEFPWVAYSENFLCSMCFVLPRSSKW